MRLPPPDKKRLTLPHYDLRLDSSADRLVLIFWTRSAAQDNVDALVKMGDYYLKGIGVPSGIPQPEKAAACYASAANTQVSSLAMHNLGWMHENGIGVSQVSLYVTCPDGAQLLIAAGRAGLSPREAIL